MSDTERIIKEVAASLEREPSVNGDVNMKPLISVVTAGIDGVESALGLCPNQPGLPVQDRQ